MNPFERQRLFTALVLLVTALFVTGGIVSDARWRRRLRVAAVTCFALAAVLALIAIVRWLGGAVGPL